MLEHIRKALKPGGRLLLVEPFNPKRRGDDREKQVERHEIAPELVEEELAEAGFELLYREDSFIENSQSSLVAARRPPVGEGKRSVPLFLSSTPRRVICYPPSSLSHLSNIDLGTELKGLQPL